MEQAEIDRARRKRRHSSVNAARQLKDTIQELPDIDERLRSELNNLVTLTLRMILVADGSTVSESSLNAF